MFEILLLIGFFTAGISQLLPVDTRMPTPKQQRRRKKQARTNYSGVNRRTRESNLRPHAKLTPRSYFVERANSQVLNPPRNRENSSAGIGLP